MNTSQRYNNFQLKLGLLAASVQSGNFGTANPYACLFTYYMEKTMWKYKS